MQVIHGLRASLGARLQGRLLLPQCRAEFPSQSRSRSSHPCHTTHDTAPCGTGHKPVWDGRSHHVPLDVDARASAGFLRPQS